MTTYEPPFDPRPDIFVDHDHWAALLKAAWQPNDADLVSEAFWSLKYARELGAMLHLEDGKAKVRRGFMDETTYAQLREEWLLPALPVLEPLLEHPERWMP